MSPHGAMPSGPSSMAGAQPVFEEASDFQSPVAVAAASHAPSVYSRSGGPLSNSTNSEAIRPAGLGRSVAFVAATARRFPPGSSSDRTSITYVRL